MFSNKLTAILLPALLLLTLFFASLLFLDTIMNISSIRQPLLNRLSDGFHYDLSTDRIEVSLWEGIGITAINPEARSREASDKIVAAKMRVKLDVMSLLNGRILPTAIRLFQPVIEVTTPKQVPSANADLASRLKDSMMRRWARLPSISLHNGRLVFTDLSCAVTGLYLNASRSSKNPGSFDVKARGKADFKQRTAPFTLQAALAPSAETSQNFISDMSLTSKRVPLAWLPWPTTLPLQQGHAGVHIKVRGPREGALSISGKLSIDELRFTLMRSDRKNTFSLPHAVLSFESSYAGRTLQIPALRLETPDFSLSAKSKIDFRQMQNPHLFLTVESPFMQLQTLKQIFPTSLVPRWIDHKLKPILEAGDARVDHFSMHGTFEQFQNLGQPENAHALSMGLTWKNLRVVADPDTLPFENVTGRLYIKNGRLFLSAVKANFGESTLSNGAMEVRNVFAAHAAYEIAINGVFDLSDLLRQKEMNLFPPRWVEKIPVPESATGKLHASARVRYQNGWRRPRIIKGEWLFKQCRIDDNDLVFPLKLETAVIRLGGKAGNQFKGKGLWGNSYFEATGTPEDFLRTRRIDVLARADMNELLGHFCPAVMPSLQVKDLIPCRISVSRALETWSFRGDVEPKGMALNSRAFTLNPKGQENRITFDLDLLPRMKLHFKRFSWVLDDSALSLSGFWNWAEKTLTDFQVRTAGLSLEALGIQFKNRNLSTNGTIKCLATLNASLNDPFDTDIQGELSGQNISVVVPGISSPMHDGQLQVKFKDKTASLKSMTLKVGRSPIHMRGRLEGWDGLKGGLTVTAGDLDAADFALKRTKALEGEGSKGLPGFLKRTDIDFTLQAPRGKWQNFEFGPLEAEGAFRMGRLYVSRSKIHLGDGLWTVQGYLNTGKTPGMAFSNYVKIADQPAEMIQPLLRSMGIQEDVKGRLTMEAVFYMKGKNKGELFSSLAGGADVVIEKGSVSKSNVIFKILDFLSLQKVFKKKPQGVSNEDFYFERIGGRVKIDDGILHTSNLDMKSPVFNVAGKGHLDLNLGTADFDLGVQPLGTMDSLVSMIPIAGYILTGEKKTLLIYYFKVEGNLPKPDVRYVPLKNWGFGIVDFLKRAFLTPKRLFEKFSRGSEALAKENEVSIYEGP
jgi:hypothetical protein